MFCTQTHECYKLHLYNQFSHFVKALLSVTFSSEFLVLSVTL